MLVDNKSPICYELIPGAKYKDVHDVDFISPTENRGYTQYSTNITFLTQLKSNQTDLRLRVRGISSVSLNFVSI